MSAALRPDEMAEVALARRSTDACVVLVTVSSLANLRWAANTLTTNGQTSGRTMTVVAMQGRRRMPRRAAHPHGTDADSIAALVADAEAAARPAPAERVPRLVPEGSGCDDFTERGPRRGHDRRPR